MENKQNEYLDFTRKPDFQSILTNPILDIAARFWEDDRYEAFKICYRSMRVVDDLVDDRKASGKKISMPEKIIIRKMIKNWLKSFSADKPVDDFQKELLDTIHQFKLPKWPWQRLAKAMLYDIDHNGFNNFTTFLRYTEGAAIAPASVFMHLCGVERKGDNYLAPKFDIRFAARHLALFSYLVHIIRDFQKDALSHLNYFADNIISQNNVTEDEINSVANSGEISQSFRNLIKDYYNLADYYRLKADNTITVINPYLTEQYQLSYKMIYQLYLQIFQKVDYKNGSFSTEELNPSPSEVQNHINLTIKEFSNKS